MPYVFERPKPGGDHGASLRSPGSASLLVIMRQGITEDRERAVLKLGLQFVAR